MTKSWLICKDQHIVTQTVKNEDEKADEAFQLINAKTQLRHRWLEDLVQSVVLHELHQHRESNGNIAQLGNASPEYSLHAASQFRWLPALHSGDVLVMKQTMEESSFAVLLFQM